MPDHPLAFLGKVDAVPEQNTRFPELLREFYDRNSRAAVLSSALGYELGINQEKIHIAGYLIKVWSDWLAGQRIEARIEVNLGSWPSLNTTKMAGEVNFLDFYNYVYQPFSSAVHSGWAHVCMFNAIHCQNPAHRWHRGAAIAPTPIDLNWLYLASKYLSKTFGHFDNVYGLNLPHVAFDLVVS